MDDKAKPEVGLGNDVQVIRNILLGEHLERFQVQFEALEKEIAALRKENKALRKELEGDSEKKYEMLGVRLEQLKNEQMEAGRAMHRSLVDRLDALDERLQAHEARYENLIGALAGALVEHRDNAGQ